MRHAPPGKRLDRAMNAHEIRGVRHALSLTQLQFAYLLGVSINTVSQWEKGRRTISRLGEQAVKNLALAYGVDMELIGA